MGLEHILIYGSSVLLFLAILFTYRANKFFGIVNTVLFVAYSSLLYYSIFFKGTGGSSFLWLFYLIILTWIHLIIVLVYLIRNRIKQPHKSFINEIYLLLIALGVVLIVVGVLFRNYHFPFGVPILFTGIVLACVGLLLLLIKKSKRKTEK